MTDSPSETQRLKQAPIATLSGASENCWRDWAERVPVMLWIADAESGCSYFNLQWTEFTGLTEAQISARGWTPNIHPDDLDSCEQIYLNAWNLNSNFKREYRLKRADGEYRWIEETAVPTLTPSGEFQGLICTATDISERKKVQEQLSSQEQFLRSIYDGIDQIIFAIDADTDGEFRYVGFNPFGKRILGLGDDSEWCGKTPEAVFGEEVGTMLRQTYISCARSQNSVTSEQCLQFQGADTWWLVTLTPLRDEAGRIYRIIGNSKEVTDRKKAADELLEYQIKLEETQKVAHIGDWEFDLNTSQITWSDELKRIYDLELNLPTPSYPELVEQIHPNDRERFQKIIEEAIASRQPYEIDYRIYRFNGEMRYLIGWGQVLQNQQGEVVKLFGAAIDITDRKQAELALQVSQESLSTVINNAPVVLFGIDCNGIFTLSEGKGLQALGIKPGEVVGLSVYELYKDSPQIIESINLVLAGEPRTWPAELNGHVLESRATPILDEKGEVAGLIAVSIDITERARVEEALRQSEAKLRLILENMPVMLSAVDADRNIIVWNRECERVLGYSAAELVGNLQAIQLLMPDINYRQKIFRKVVELGHNFRDLEVEIQAADGSVKTIAWSNVSADFSVPGWDFWGIGVDVTERTAAELALRESEAQLREQAAQLEKAYHALTHTQAQLVQSEKMSSLGQLVAGVAHEINNPVSFIFGNISYAKDYTNDLLRLLELYRAAYPEPTAEIQAELEEIELEFIREDLPNLLDSMAVGADRIQEIVKSLRTFSRLDEADFKAVNLHEGIDSTLMIIAHLLKPEGDKLAISIIKEYGNLPQVECYSGQLNQVFMNLLINAIDAVKESERNSKSAGGSSPIPTIKIRTEVMEGERVKIAIADSGTGIPESMQQRLFDPFFTTKPVGKGTGLGLAISYEIVVKKHQGKLLCNSELGIGTEFAIEIPIRQPQAEEKL
ncbi:MULTISPECIES: PAS domain S-box protein [unclassified Microcoleus]|uniref:PAS domain S-box protein n=1 Tax=unclassified Microcoleus TaxID=2642155 RepID=UPI002FD5111E